jgi:NAD(P)-dependent dehydrogenase (short-subunit alcohol dehydrogenase family)
MGDDIKRAILITGCSSGIGYAAAHGLAERGWRVFATCRKEEDCARLRGEGLDSFRLDYEDPPSIAEAYARCLDEVEDLPVKALKAIFQANVFGWHDLIRMTLPAMRNQGHGRIVQNSSVLGFAALKYRGAYNATKFAIEGLTDTLRLELRGTGIHVVLIEPGPIDTKIRINSYPHFKKWIDWQSSIHREFYESYLIPRLEAEHIHSPLELPPSAVVKHALEAPRPRPRYYVTLPTHIMGAARRLLSTRLMDALADRASS